MSFKFKIGTTVQKVEAPEAGRFTVIGLLLNDRINVRDLNTHSSRIVEAKNYEEVEKKNRIPDY